MSLIHPWLDAPAPRAERADGIYVWSGGRRYIDACSGAVCVNIGHNAPVVAASLAAAGKGLDYVVRTAFDNIEALDLADLIAAEWAPAGLGNVWFSTSGSDAVETGIRLARQFWVESGQPSRHKIISTTHSYHGSTLGALAATGREPRAMYEPYFTDAWIHTRAAYPYRCPNECGGCDAQCAQVVVAAIEQADPATVAAVIMEPVVGLTTGGTAGSPAYYQEVARACREHGILFIADEVMTGFGRTGVGFAFEHFGIEPDIVPTGKGLGCGYVPLFATLVSDRVIEAIRDGSGRVALGNTYTAHPLSCRLGLDILGQLRDADLVASARRSGALLLRRLHEIAERSPIVGEARGYGLLCGLEFVRNKATREPFDPASRVAALIGALLRREGVVLAARTGTIDNVRGDHIVVAPPLTITTEQVEDLTGRIAAGIALAEQDLVEETVRS